MSHQERIIQASLKTPIVVALLTVFALFSAGCGGGGATSTAGTTGTTTTPPTTTNKVILAADAGSVCETLVSGLSYTRTPTLTCNGSSSPYMARLDGSKSVSPDGSALTYSWTFVSKPAGSTASLSGASTANPTFQPDKAGAYTVQLTVSANGATSSRAVALVVALDNAALTSTPTYHFHGGLSNNCSNCHSGSYPQLLTKPTTHIASSNNCQACHSPLGFNVMPFVDHKEVFGSCSVCHDGTTAIGKSVFHKQTTQECSDCHNTTKFVQLPRNPDGSYDHSSVTEPCTACHNGTVAIDTSSDPNPAGHPSISVECNGCHTTATFSTPFPNHSDPKIVAPGTCGSTGCHANGTTYTDVKGNILAVTTMLSAPNPHIDVNNSPACDACHNTTSFNMGGVFSHSVLGQLPAQGITVSCSTCHDGLNATGIPAPTATFTHPTLLPGQECSDCHSTATFNPALTVDHTGFDPATKDCFTGCHNGSNATGAPTDVIHNTTTNSAFSPTLCGTCHTPPGGSFHTASIDHSGFGPLGSPTVDCTSCHDGSIPTAQAKPSNHISTSDNCGVCHSPQGVSFVGGLYDHSGVTVTMGTPSTSTPDTCTSCHDGSITATSQSVTHVPMTAASGTDCVVCHFKGPGFASALTDFSTFKMDVFDHAQAGITKNCTSCHDGKTHDTTLVITKPAAHIPTSGADCSTCHDDTTNGPTVNGTNGSGFRLSAAPFINTVHPKYTTGCRSCHNGDYSISPYNAPGHPTNPADPVTGSFVALHNDADAKGWECNACHSTAGNFLDGSVNHQDATLMAPGCFSCHVDGSATSPLGRLSGHIGYGTTNYTNCKDCHQPGGSFATYDHSLLTVTGSGNTKTSTPTQCLVCHDGVTATGKPQNHVTTSRDCISCHTGYPPTVSTYTGTGSFDHATAPEMAGKLCMDCHDGTILGALGKQDAVPTHQVTSSDCGACHSTTAFKPATSFDHTGVTSGCQASGCHTSGNPDVVDVTDDPNTLPHIPIMNGTEVDCINCHTNPGGTFANATMNHTVVTFEPCETCHGGTTSKYDGANTAHMVTIQSTSHINNSSGSTKTISTITSCKTCHTSTSDWTQVKYTHRSKTASPPGYYPGDHNTGKVSSCTQCHKDSPPKYLISSFDSPVGRNNVSRPQYYPYCAGCHGATGEGQHGAPLSSSHYDCTGSGCHKVNGTSFNN